MPDRPNTPEEPRGARHPVDAAGDGAHDMPLPHFEEVEAMDQWLEAWTEKQRTSGLGHSSGATSSTVADLFAGLPSPRPKFMTQLWDRLAAHFIAPVSRGEARRTMTTTYATSRGGTITAARSASTLIANPDTIRVLIVEREPLFRRGLAGCLADRASGCEVIGGAATAEEGYRLADEHLPDVVLVGTTLADAPASAAATELRRRYPVDRHDRGRRKGERRRALRRDSRRRLGLLRQGHRGGPADRADHARRPPASTSSTSSSSTSRTSPPGCWSSSAPPPPGNWPRPARSPP